MSDLLIVDDQKLCRLSLASLLEKTDDISIIGEAETGIEAVQWIRNYPIDIVLMDLDMPKMSGLEACKRILKIRPDTKILVLTASSDQVYPARLLRAGALGYLTKGGSDRNELINAIRTIKEGERYIPESVANRIVERRFVRDEINDLWDGLSDRELEVLSLLVIGKESKEISNELRLGISTVNCYRHRIIRQLKVKNTIELINLAIEYKIIE